jgi:hypothetical protein
MFGTNIENKTRARERESATGNGHVLNIISSCKIIEIKKEMEKYIIYVWLSYLWG